MISLHQTQSQLQIFEEILDCESHKPVNISIIDKSIFVKLEAKDKSATCSRCGCQSHQLHQNHERLVKDLDWNGKAVYLQINSRQFKCKKCDKPFTETLKIKPFRRSYTKRFALDIVDQVLTSNILAVSERTGLSEYQIQHILNDVGKLLRTQKPQNLIRLGIDEISLRKGSGRYCAVLVDLDSHESTSMKAIIWKIHQLNPSAKFYIIDPKTTDWLGLQLYPNTVFYLSGEVLDQLIQLKTVTEKIFNLLDKRIELCQQLLKSGEALPEQENDVYLIIDEWYSLYDSLKKLPPKLKAEYDKI